MKTKRRHATLNAKIKSIAGKLHLHIEKMQHANRQADKCLSAKHRCKWLEIANHHGRKYNRQVQLLPNN